MDAVRRERLALGLAVVAWSWPIGLLGALIFLPRWYLLDDWRETVVRVAFFAGLVVAPTSAALAIWLAKRSPRRGSPRRRSALLLAWIMLGLLALAALALVAFFGLMET